MRGTNFSLIALITWCICITLFVLSIMVALAIIKIPSKLDDLNYTLMRLQGKEDKSDKRYDNKPWEE